MCDNYKRKFNNDRSIFANNRDRRTLYLSRPVVHVHITWSISGTLS